MDTNIMIPDGAQIIALKAIVPEETDKSGSRVLLLDEVLNGTKSVQLIRVDCNSTKFYRIKFLPFPGAAGTTLPFSTFKEAKRIFELAKTILLF